MAKKNTGDSPLHFISGAISALGAYDWGGKRAKAEAGAQDEYNQMKSKFMGLDTSNLYGDVSNPYANMENTMEDLTVNTQQADFMAQQGAQTRSNVMQNMRGAAGGSGVAGLAQAMANQGQQASQQASASIGQQESANQKASAQQAGQLQTMERQGDWKADMTRRSGAEQSRQLVKEKTNTLFGMATDKLSTAKAAVQEGKDAMYSGVGDMFSPF